jgi:hypothetical protein
MNRAKRRKKTAAKLVKRAKLFWVLYNSSESDWREMVSKERWAKKLRHGKLYGRSTMANIEKHQKVKKIRQESKELSDTKIIDNGY